MNLDLDLVMGMEGRYPGTRSVVKRKRDRGFTVFYTHCMYV